MRDRRPDEAWEDYVDSMCKEPVIWHVRCGEGPDERALCGQVYGSTTPDPTKVRCVKCLRMAGR